ncbi:MAG: hypothetical protein OEV42_07320 [Deltaproteobacteria bacterium]|nr:hypothetical protein [Deltaproteobacteria bacterium]
MDKKMLQQIFGPSVKVRVEGNEYLLYNRNTDGLYIVGMKNVEKLGALLTESSPSAMEEAKSGELGDFAAALHSQGMLSKELVQITGAEQTLERLGAVPEVQSLKAIGDLTVAAWPISANTQVLAYK